mmetsp:Transcript_9595/g.33722  ORF Transcript_9595/g.33722 Transcript_9595/m.33722 type:complete len:243 (-) Transcript_9595:527-1255(-)
MIFVSASRSTKTSASESAGTGDMVFCPHGTVGQPARWTQAIINVATKESTYSKSALADLRSWPVKATTSSTGILQNSSLQTPGRIPPADGFGGSWSTATAAYFSAPPRSRGCSALKNLPSIVPGLLASCSAGCIHVVLPSSSSYVGCGTMTRVSPNAKKKQSSRQAPATNAIFLVFDTLVWGMSPHTTLKYGSHSNESQFNHPSSPERPATKYKLRIAALRPAASGEPSRASARTIALTWHW